MRRSVVVTAAFVVATLAFAGSVSGQAILGDIGGGGDGVVFPSPGVGLPNPAQMVISGLPVGASVQGVSYFGSDNALLSGLGGGRIFVVQISTAMHLATIPTAPTYDGSGTVAVVPGLNFALASGNSTTLAVIAAPFNAMSTVTPVTLPGQIASYQTQAIVFNAAGRAFVYHSTGISVLDPPYISIAFTIPVANPSSGAIAITPSGNQLLATLLTGNDVLIFTAPFSSLSTPVTLDVTGGSNLDGIMVTPNGQQALVVQFSAGAFFAINAPFSASSTFETIVLNAAAGGLEDVGISADGQLAILAGGGGANTILPFVEAPFTAAGATVHIVTVPGGRGSGGVRFLPPGLAPGLIITKSGPPTIASGADLTYTITYGNTGTADATNVVIKETIPAGTTFVSATGGGTFAAGVVTWNIGTVMDGVTGQTVSFTVNVTATSGNIDNVDYTIEGDGIAEIPGPPISTQIGGGQVTPTITPSPTVTPTVTPSPTLTPTATTGTPSVGAPAIPTLSAQALALLAIALVALSVALLRRRG